MLALVALPVLPLQFNGFALPTWTGPSWADLCRMYLPGQNKPARKRQPATTVAAQPSPIGQLQLMEKASRDLNTLIAQNPTDPSLHNRLGIIYLGLGELNEAQEHFQRAVQLARAAIITNSERGKVMQYKGALADAAALVVESSRLNVELSAAHSNLARVYEKLGQHAKVLAELDELNHEGTMNDAAATAYSPGTASASACTHRLTPEVTRLLARAEVLMQAHRVGESIAEFKNLIALDPDVAVAHRDLGICYALMSDHPAAATEFEIASRLQPGDAVSENNLGLVLQSLGKPEEAARHFRQAISYDPRLAEASINLGNLAAAAERYDEARQVLQSAVRNNPDSPVAHNNLATIFSLQDRPSEAAGEFRQALALKPDMVSAHYGLGLALFKSKQYRLAVQEFKQALLLNPHLMGAHEKIEQALRKASLTDISPS